MTWRISIGCGAKQCLGAWATPPLGAASPACLLGFKNLCGTHPSRAAWLSAQRRNTLTSVVHRPTPVRRSRNPACSTLLQPDGTAFCVDGGATVHAQTQCAASRSSGLALSDRFHSSPTHCLWRGRRRYSSLHTDPVCGIPPASHPPPHRLLAAHPRPALSNHHSTLLAA
jgi:hypothetical protein